MKRTPVVTRKLAAIENRQMNVVRRNDAAIRYKARHLLHLVCHRPNLFFARSVPAVTFAA